MSLRLFLRRISIGKLNKNTKDGYYIVTSRNSSNWSSKAKFRFLPNYKLVGCCLAAYVGYSFYRQKYVLSKTIDQNTFSAGDVESNLPLYSIDEVSKHNNKNDGIWVTYKQGVYDVTKFVEQHPGGEQILLAAGSSVEPFWMLYGVHNNPQILALLETFRIGNISEKEVIQNNNMSDPYGYEPKRHSALKPASIKPFNAETPLSLLVESYITPKELFYVRNHLPVPQVDPSTFELEIEAPDKQKKLSLEDLKKLPKHTVTAAIMCSGNRRSDMTKVRPVKGLSWDAGAVGNATWSGPYLRDVLKLIGVDENSNFRHVQFEGLDTDTTNSPYGASIPFWKAVDRKGDVILAYEMNGEPLTPDHGFPVRVVVPGTTGARNVKWLGRIVVSNTESESHWQRFDYKGFSPNTNYDNVDYSKSPAIQELPVTSAICKPAVDEVVKVNDGHICVKGYAWSGGGCQIVRVDVTIDGGKTWHVADIDHQDNTPSPHNWAWSLWSVKIPVEKDKENVEIWAKAVDASYNVQPETFDNIWNFRGVLSNAYHRVPIKCVFS